MLRKILTIISRNFLYKLAAFGLAILVWAIIQGEQIEERSIDIKVNIQVPPGFAIRGDLVQTKSARIRGPRVWMIDSPKVLETDFVIPMGKRGRFRGRLEKERIKKLNQRFELVIHDPYIEVYVDRQIERTVSVKEILQGTPAEGYLIEKVTLEPRVVTLQGLREDLLKIRQVVTEPIDIADIKSNRTKEVKIISPNTGVKNMGVTSVQVNLKVGDSKINKRFGSIPIEVLGSNSKVKVRPAYVSIMVQGTPGILNFVKRPDFRAFIEAQGLKPGRYEQDIKVKIPSDTVLIETFPEKGIVTILPPDDPLTIE
ncbi:MAG: hypothetical protein HRU19_00290 [Pseudobacteriovorax sp.]|nr:hypothetical protein [Pseudobacteriovorax sp.]